MPVFAVGPSHGDAGRRQPAAVLRAAAGPDHRGPDRASRRAPHAREHHEARRHRLQRRSSRATASRRSRWTASRTRPWPAPGGSSSTAPRAWSSPATDRRRTPSSSERWCRPAAQSDPTPPLPPRSSTRTRRWSLVSQGTVDNTDPSKLIVPTLEALAGRTVRRGRDDGRRPDGGAAGALRRTERRHRGLHRLRRLVPARGRLVTNCGIGSVHGGDAPRGARGRRGQERGQERHRRARRLQPPRGRPPQRATEAGQDPRRGAPCARRPDVRRQRRRAADRAPSPTTRGPASRPRSTTSRWRRRSQRCRSCVRCLAVRVAARGTFSSGLPSCGHDRRERDPRGAGVRRAPVPGPGHGLRSLLPGVRAVALRRR